MLVFSMLAVALFSAFERKTMSFMQSRVGPEKVSVLGIFQPFSDALKLMTKEEKSVEDSLSFFFYLPSSLLLSFSILSWWLFPCEEGFFSWSKSSFFLLFIFSISVYSIVVMGWYSNSKYAALGCVRSTVQTISYEVGIAITIIFLCLSFTSLTLEKWVIAQRDVLSFVWMPALFFISLFMFLVEVNRSPFDLSEGESELVSGFCVEYGGVGYTLIFLGENLSLLWVGVLLSLFFFSGKEIFFSFLLILFVWIRATFPRIRFDKLMFFFWAKTLPVLLGVMSFYITLLYL